MARKLGRKVRIDVEPPVREMNSDEPGMEAPTPEPAPSAPVLPMIDGVQVLEVLDDPKTPAGFRHVRLADGTTRHVAQELINQ
jgi:hypothetical protein